MWAYWTLGVGVWLLQSNKTMDKIFHNIYRNTMHLNYHPLISL